MAWLGNERVVPGVDRDPLKRKDSPSKSFFE